MGCGHLCEAVRPVTLLLHDGRTNGYRDMPNNKGERRRFGSIRRLPSKRYQASYVGPDLARHTAPTTFEAREDAEAWLTARRREVERGDWRPPSRERPQTLRDYADRWLAERDGLRPRTRTHYRWLLDSRILPELGDVPLAALTGPRVRSWHAAMGSAAPTSRAHAYTLLKTVLGTAVDDRLIDHNPCHVRGAGQTRRQSRTQTLTPAELGRLADAMPDRLRPMVLLAGWCGLRFGELAALTAADIDPNAGTVSVTKAVVRVGGTPELGSPKSDAGVRIVTIPPHVLPQVVAALPDQHDAVLFPGARGGYLQPATLYRHYYKARAAIGRPTLRFHDLRHTGLTLAALSGATLADLMRRAGHTTAGVAVRYQHAVDGRDRDLAAALSRLASGA